MLEAELYLLTRLKELDDARFGERCRVLMELEAQRPRRQSALRVLLAPRVLALGEWLERIGNSMAAEPAPQE